MRQFLNKPNYLFRLGSSLVLVRVDHKNYIVVKKYTFIFLPPPAYTLRYIAFPLGNILVLGHISSDQSHQANPKSRLPTDYINPLHVNARQHHEKVATQSRQVDAYVSRQVYIISIK